ncbi:MAG: hypothetical protein AAGA48_38990 [Myxococcota bacterium]
MSEETEPPTTPKKSSPSVTAQDVFAVILGGLAIVYLLNPTLGVFELIPDNTPIIGNLDEAAATVILLAALGHFGIEIPRTLFGKEAKPEDEAPNTASSAP